MHTRSKVALLIVGLSLLVVGSYAQIPAAQSPAGNSQEAIQKDAEARDPGALYLLATKYEDGKGVPRDMAKAIGLYRQAAELGYLPAQTYLGVIYDKARGVPRDDAEAIKWYQLAADKGDPQSQFNLGVFLIQGRGTTKNEKAGWDLVRKAAEGGYQPARSALLRAPN